MSNKVKCGFNKWSIQIDNNGNVVVEFGRHPIFGSITLSDLSLEDCRNLSEMFAAEARDTQIYIDKNK